MENNGQMLQHTLDTPSLSVTTQNLHGMGTQVQPGPPSTGPQSSRPHTGAHGHLQSPNQAHVPQQAYTNMEQLQNAYSIAQHVFGNKDSPHLEGTIVKFPSTETDSSFLHSHQWRERHVINQTQGNSTVFTVPSKMDDNVDGRDRTSPDLKESLGYGYKAHHALVQQLEAPSDLDHNS